MTDSNDRSDKSGWTGKAALAGAAIGSAALAAALLYASRRKERLAKDKTVLIPAPQPQAKPEDTPETD